MQVIRATWKGSHACFIVISLYLLFKLLTLSLFRKFLPEFGQSQVEVLKTISGHSLTVKRVLFARSVGPPFFSVCPRHKIISNRSGDTTTPPDRQSGQSGGKSAANALENAEKKMSNLLWAIRWISRWARVFTLRYLASNERKKKAWQTKLIA